MHHFSISLRWQLLLGLGLIIIAVTLTLGFTIHWSDRARLLNAQMNHGRLLGGALSQLIGADKFQAPSPTPLLQQTLANFSAGQLVRGAALVDQQQKILASSGTLSDLPQLPDSLLQALRTEQQQAAILDGTRPRLLISTPIFSQGKILGATMLELPVIPAGQENPQLFATMMIIDGFALLFFVWLVITHYVLKPIATMQQAALQVAQGNMDVRLNTEGAAELSSLAESFNTMTAAVQEQLVRLEQQRQELADTREQIIRSEKLASVGRLAAGVAHEVGNPLQSIIGFTDVLLSGGPLTKQQIDFLQRIQDQSQRINEIIRGLLDFARPAEDEIEAVSLQSLVNSALALVTVQKKWRQIKVSLVELDQLPLAAGNSKRLIQVLLNLLLNAADAMNGQGSVIIRGAHLRPEEKVQLCVENDGPPISPEHRGRIFDPFFTTKEPGAGTGLGLSVAQSLIESYGGRLWLAEEGPTAFMLSLHVWKSESEQRS